MTAGIGATTVEFLDLAGATGTGFQDDTAGNAIMCPATCNLRIVDSILRDSVGDGFRCGNCTVTALRSQFINNTRSGFNVTDATVTIDG